MIALALLDIELFKTSKKVNALNNKEDKEKCNLVCTKAQSRAQGLRISMLAATQKQIMSRRRCQQS